MIESKSEIEHRTQEQSLCSTVSPVALGATNRIQPSKARFPFLSKVIQYYCFHKYHSNSHKDLLTMIIKHTDQSGIKNH